MDFEFLNVGTKKDERGETGGGDGITFGNGFHGIADGVELVGTFANRFRHAGHDCDPARVVGDGAEGVEGYDDACHGEHGHDGDGDAVESCEVVAKEDGDADKADGQGGSVGADGEASDNVGGVASFGGLCDMADGGAVGGGVVVGDEENDEGHEKADEGSEVNAVGGGYLAVVTKPFWKKDMSERPENCGGGEGTNENAEAEKTGGVPFAEVDSENPENRGEDGDAADNEGVGEGSGIGLAIAPEDGEVGHENTADEADGVGFKDIGGHPSAIADVIADVVGNGGGVARVIFFELGFEFANEVCADIGSFGVDATAQTSEDADERGSESEAGQAIDGGTEAEPAGGDEIEGADGEEGEGDDE